MGGRIGVDSQLGEGSSFRFELGFEVDPDPPPADAVDSAISQLDRLSATLVGTVLVVEDNPVNRVIAEEMLQSLGLSCIEAEDGQQAVDLLERRRVDLVLMDCQMPVMDGYTATQLIRARETRLRLPRTPIVALTANAYDEDADQALAAGMDAHLPKPYTRDQLREVLRAWL
jgi:two-component system, sensor histidine kinase